MTVGGATRLILEKQLLHLVLLLALLLGLFLLGSLDGFLDGSLWSIDTEVWLVLAVASAIAHQVYVWFCWRTQLHLSLLTRMMGSGAFQIYAAKFTFLLFSRILLITALAFANRGSLHANPDVLNVVALIVALPALYTLYSVMRYFGHARACGADHFDESYRGAPLERRGVFRFTSNAMYVFGLLVLWLPGLLLSSMAALSVALFHHLYIWVHYHCTEKPDMIRIYPT